jgi:hypothetical protein
MRVNDKGAIFYNEDQGRGLGDGQRLAFRVIQEALSAGDRRFFQSPDFLYWLGVAGIPPDDFRIKALLGQVARMPRQTPLTPLQKLRRSKDELRP